MLTVTALPSGSTVELNWLPPLHPNGAIHYEIEYEQAMTPGFTTVEGGTDLYFNLTLPKEFVTYNVRVVAVNTQGSRSGESNTVSVCPGRNRGVCPTVFGDTKQGGMRPERHYKARRVEPFL